MSDNLVDVDQAALAAEVDALAIPADVPAAPVPEAGAAAGMTEADAERIARNYEAGAVILVAGAARVLAPAWDVTATECSELGKALALAAAYWFPEGGLPPKYMALLNVAAIGAGIVIARQDESGTLRPLKHRKAPAAGIAPAASAPADAGAVNAQGGAKLPDY